METEGEERVRARHSLEQLEDAAIILNRDARAGDFASIADDVPRKLSAILHSMTTIPSRDDAERLLEAGVTFWNAVIILEGKQGSKNIEALVKVRHVAADCIYMAVTVLGGISSRFDIDEVSLLKFYTAVGRKYATDLLDLEMANVCFKKAFEFGKSALALVDESEEGSSRSQGFSKAMFDLLLGSAEAAWERGDADEAENLVADARKYLGSVPGDIEYMASVEFNIGLHAYQQKAIDKALQWLQRSMRSRRSNKNTTKDVLKESKVARLLGVCHIAQQKYEDARKLLQEAEDLCHDPSGAYLLLKVVILTGRTEEVWPLLKKNLNDSGADVEVCIANVSLMADARNSTYALDGYQILWNRFAKDPEALVKHIGTRYMESLCSAGKGKIAIDVLGTCCDLLDAVFSSDQDAKEKWFVKYSNVSLRAGVGLADRKCYDVAALILEETIGRTQESHFKEEVFGNNEAGICRLAASCSLCAAEFLQKKAMNHENVPEPSPIIGAEQFLKTGLEYALHSKTVDPDDFGARVLVFRSYLALGESTKAAEELRRASSEIAEFDVGSLAAAACSAKDANASDAVLAALQCILKSKSALSASETMDEESFYGTVLCAAVEIIVDQGGIGKGDSTENVQASTSVPISRDSLYPGKEDDHSSAISAETLPKLISTLTIGLEGVKRFESDKSFGRSVEGDTILNFLVDVSWNAGRDAAINDALDYSWTLFDLVHDFSCMKRRSLDKLQTCKIARLMAANALIKGAEIASDHNSDKKWESARAKLEEVREIVKEILRQNPMGKEDSILALATSLDARCLSGLGDSFTLHALVTQVSNSSFCSPALMDQLASICYDENINARARHSDDYSTLRDNMLDSCVFCLTWSLDKRLMTAPIDLSVVAALCREVIKIELSRRAENAYPIAARAIGLFEEHHGSVNVGSVANSSVFPADEGRWLTAIAWETSQMSYRMGKIQEAIRWANLACRAAKNDLALASYLPRIQQFINEMSG